MKPLPPLVAFWMGRLLFMKSAKSKKVPKKKKDRKKKSLGKAKRCLKIKGPKKKKKDRSLPLPTLFVGQRNLFYSEDRLVQNHILLLKVCLIHWDANIFFSGKHNVPQAEKKDKKKLKAVAEVVSETCAPNSAASSSRWGGQCRGSGSAQTHGEGVFPPPKKKK